jgi:hypothetical protein
MPLATQVTNTPIHITSSSTGMSVTSASPVVRVTDSIDVKFEPGLLSSAATGTIDIDANSAQVVYHSSSTGNFIFNFRGDSTTALSTTMQVGHVMTVSVIINNGATPYYATSVRIDGTTVTPKWAGGSAPSAGTASACDIYTFNIIKLTDTPTYLVIGTFGSYS